MTDRFNPAGNALITEQNRVRRSRATAGRALTRRRWRRRVLPPLAVTSAVMLGTGTAGAWVHAALQTASPAASTDTGPQLAGLDQLRQQLVADQQTLASLTGVAVPQAAGGASTVVSAAPAAVTAGPALAAAPSAKTASGTKASTAKATTSSGKTPAGAGTAAGKPATAQTAGQPAGGTPAQTGGGQAATAPAAAPAPTTAAAKPTTPAPAPTTQAPAPTPTVHATTGASGAKP